MHIPGQHQNKIDEYFQGVQQSTTLEQSSTNTKENNEQLFIYNLIQNHSIQYSEQCNAIAINQDNSIILAGCNNKIKVYQFKQEQLTLIQLLSEHQKTVYALNFMKKSTQFISGSYLQIIIWSMDQHSQWICQDVL
ncbi:unnamed protein product [Paramecium octaurelia]|uniref:Uncharacterized protein n=1 Tax=Paramecium octaurelia TaxID=43137 RepID=A0A8S1UTM6_PAROT|nr:unnamed protein product [Paramecium octaurelia]